MLEVVLAKGIRDSSEYHSTLSVNGVQLHQVSLTVIFLRYEMEKETESGPVQLNHPSSNECQMVK